MVRWVADVLSVSLSGTGELYALLSSFGAPHSTREWSRVSCLRNFLKTFNVIFDDVNAANFNGRRANNLERGKLFHVLMFENPRLEMRY